MIRLIDAIPFTIAAILMVTLIDTVGAIASRVLNFNYVYLTPVSFGVYILIGYFITPKCGLSVSILASLIVGFYDGTVGWNLSKRYEANFQIDEDEIEKMTPTVALLIMLVLSPLLALIGYWLN